MILSFSRIKQKLSKPFEGEYTESIWKGRSAVNETNNGVGFCVGCLETHINPVSFTVSFVAVLLLLFCCGCSDVFLLLVALAQLSTNPLKNIFVSVPLTYVRATIHSSILSSPFLFLLLQPYIEEIFNTLRGKMFFSYLER